MFIFYHIFTKFESYKRSGESSNRILYNVFGYVRTVLDDFESNKWLNLISVILISGVHCIYYIFLYYKNIPFLCSNFLKILLNFCTIFSHWVIPNTLLSVITFPDISFFLFSVGMERGCIVFKGYGFSARYLNNFTIFFHKIYHNNSPEVIVVLFLASWII